MTTLPAPLPSYYAERPVAERFGIQSRRDVLLAVLAAVLCAVVATAVVIPMLSFDRGASIIVGGHSGGPIEAKASRSFEGGERVEGRIVKPVGSGTRLDPSPHHLDQWARAAAARKMARDYARGLELQRAERRLGRRIPGAFENAQGYRP